MTSLRLLACHLMYASILFYGCERPPGLLAIDDPNKIASVLGHTGTFSVMRDSLGVALRLYSTTDSKVIVVHKAGFEVKQRPGVGAFLTSTGSFREFPDLATYFSHDEIPFGKPAGQTGVDYGGRYFFVVGGIDATWIGAIDDPRKPKARFSMSANRIFTKEDDIYLCGWEPNRHDGTACLVLKQHAADFERIDGFFIPDCQSVVDIDPYSDNVLGLGFGDVMPLWYVYNRQSRAIRSVGIAHRHGFFLERDFLAAVEKRLGE